LRFYSANWKFHQPYTPTYLQSASATESPSIAQANHRTRTQSMQRARCCAANAYDATAAFHAVFGRTPTPRHLRRLSSVRNEIYSQSQGERRSYSTHTEDASTPTDSRARKLAFYEELMANESGTRRERRDQKPVKHGELENEASTRRERRWPEPEPKEEPVDVGGPWDARPGLSLLGEPLWKTKMMELSQHIRESRLAKFQKTQEDGNDPEPPTTLDYQGVAIRPEISKVYPRQRPPWATVCDQKTAGYTAAQILDAEIRAFAEYMSPTKEEQVARNAVCRNIRSIIQSDPDNKDVSNYHFGSTRTGLALPFSDVDLGVYHSYNTSDNLEQLMERLSQTLRNGKDYMLVVHRPPPNAIITAQHKVTGIDVQVIAKGLPGKQDAFMETYLKKIPNLRELYTVVRTVFGTRGFVNPFIGGISAYGTSIMIVAALTRRGTPPDIRESVSAQLLYFLEFWANFDMTKYGIAFSNPLAAKIVKKTPPDESEADKEERMKIINALRRKGDLLKAGQIRIGRLRPEQPYLLCLQDPSTPVNDLGARCHAIKHIQETIKVMHTELLRSMEEYDQTNPDTKLRDGEPRESLLMPLVGRSHELYAERRKRMVAGNPKALAANVSFRRVNIDTPDHLRGASHQRDELSRERYVRK
jgi:non-canonical poly(A) RNA polymerase PAPD5/7